MSWFRFASIYAALCGVAFFFFPRLSNEIFGINYVISLHGEDWLQLFGLTGFSFAYLLNAAHASTNEEMKRTVARAQLIFNVPCALIMTYWQIIPDERWNRLDIANIVILCILSYGMFLNSGLMRKGEAVKVPT
jgi:drug/metabolite transporter (DMT)-like permease